MRRLFKICVAISSFFTIVFISVAITFFISFILFIYFFLFFCFFQFIQFSQYFFLLFFPVFLFLFFQVFLFSVFFRVFLFLFLFFFLIQLIKGKKRFLYWITNLMIRDCRGNITLITAFKRIFFQLYLHFSLYIPVFKFYVCKLKQKIR